MENLKWDDGPVKPVQKDLKDVKEEKPKVNKKQSSCCVYSCGGLRPLLSYGYVTHMISHVQEG